MGSVTRHWGNTNRANTRIYKIWSKMKDRCTNPNNQYYHRYGGRGIHYWYTWQSFEVFAVWARELGITPATFHKRMLKDPNNKDRWFRPKEMRYDTSGKCKCSCR